MPTTNEPYQATTYETQTGWTVLARPDRDRPGFFKVTAVAANRVRVIHRDRLTEAAALAFDADAAWSAR